MISDTPQVEPVIDDEEPPSSPCSIEVDITCDDAIGSPLDSQTVVTAVHAACLERGFSVGTIGVRMTDDATIRVINAQHLGHDYATDVISFGYAADGPYVEGELVVSVDTAKAQSGEIGWPLDHELLLYIVHGVLHITGMDDHEPTDRAEMRAAEERIFRRMGIAGITRFGADLDDQESDDDHLEHGPVLGEGKE